MKLTDHLEEGLPPPPAPEWVLGEAPAGAAVEALRAELRLPEPLCRILAGRGIEDPDEAKRFLRPSLGDLHDPALLRDAGRAADRILAAIARGETILVHGDYDVDGICAAALLTLWLRRLGAEVVPFVPHRINDGYDLGEGGIRAAREVGASLVVTCDSGIRAHDAISRLRDEGVDVIVTDHHTPGESLPPAFAVVNPVRSDCDYPDPGLAGAGVAYKLCELLARKRGIAPEELHPHLDLVALATVADLVPLTGENRVLVRFGLRALAITARPGLRTLMRVARIDPGSLDAQAIAFQIGPRLNAAGRIGAASDALRLLLTDDARDAAELAPALEAMNSRRRDEDRRTYRAIERRLAGEFDPVRDQGVVVAGEGWHPGVIGIVATKVAQRVYRPAVVIALDEGVGRGSARSVPEVDLHRAVSGCAEHLERFGGHRQAAGLELHPDRVEAFRAAFNREVGEQLGGRRPRPKLRGEVPVRLEELTEELHHFMSYLGPFGNGNSEPVFWARGVSLAGEGRIVASHHLKLALEREGEAPLDAIGFGVADRVPPAALGRGPVDLLFYLRENEYRGARSLQAVLRDVRPAGAGTGPTRTRPGAPPFA